MELYLERGHPLHWQKGEDMLPRFTNVVDAWEVGRFVKWKSQLYGRALREQGQPTQRQRKHSVPHHKKVILLATFRSDRDGFHCRGPMVSTLEDLHLVIPFVDNFELFEIPQEQQRRGGNIS